MLSHSLLSGSFPGAGAPLKSGAKSASVALPPFRDAVNLSEAAGDGRAARCSVPCAHCGLPAPPTTDGAQAFCCNGCRGAYQLIHSLGLGDYYPLRDRMAGGLEASAVAAPSDYSDLDDPDVVSVNTTAGVAGERCTARLAVDGIHCGACAWLIERAVPLVPGWRAARVRMNDHSVEIAFDPCATRLSQIASTLDQLGYRLLPYREEDEAAAMLAQNRAALINIAAAGFFASNAMWIAVALYAGDASGIAGDHQQLLRASGVALGLGAVFWPGRVFLRGAVAAIRTRTPHMDLPVALALVVGSVAGIGSLFLDRHDLYFDSLAMLVFLLLVGRWLQMRGGQLAHRRISRLTRLAPRMAQRIGRDGKIERVRAATLAPGDLVRVDAGDGAPTDGVVMRGHSDVDRSLLTGESQTAAVGPGGSIDAGAINVSSPLDVRVTRAEHDSCIRRLDDLVQLAASTRSSPIPAADRIGGVFVIAVIALAIAASVLHAPSGLAAATSAAIATLIVTCPCALALATPLSVAMTLGRAAKRKILIRDGSVPSQLARGGVLWLDKTGTLTAGRPEVTDLVGSTETLAIASAVESSCRHPLAESIVAEAQQRGVSVPIATDVTVRPGAGVTATVAGRPAAVGSAALMQQLNIQLPQSLHCAACDAAASGATPIWVAVDGCAIGVIALENRLRSDAASTIHRLEAAGWQPGILSGDDQAAVDRVADQLGIPRSRCFGGLTPEAKLARLKESRALCRRVAFVGDGANDAAALAAADVGMALRGGAELSLRAAPVYLAGGTLAAVADLADASRRFVGLVQLTLGVSLLYNVAAAALALSGHVTPLVAAVLMPISSLTVISMTLFGQTFTEAPR